jgi:outer membrane PBP1 activator LpoA protein
MQGRPAGLHGEAGAAHRTPLLPARTVIRQPLLQTSIMMLRPSRGLLFALAALLAACVAVPPQQTEATRRAEQAARELFAAGSYREAAESYLRLASTVASPKAEEFRLSAIEALIAAGELEDVRSRLQDLRVGERPISLRARQDIVWAQLLLAEGHPLEALNRLGATYAGPLPPELEARLRMVRAKAYAQSGNPIEAARERVNLEFLLTDPKAIDQNRQAIWQLVNRLQPAVLSAVMVPPPDTLGGWLELVAIGRQHTADLGGLAAALQEWQRRYPGHPAMQAVVPELLESLRYAVSRPRHIALMLPQEGRFADAAAAIRDGFIAAWYQDTGGEGELPVISIYDATPATIRSAYQRAVDAGADFVVGPLDRDSVTVLARAGNLPAPTLALNYAETPPAPEPPGPGAQPPAESAGMLAVSMPPTGAGTTTRSAGQVAASAGSLYQFALSPEDEARQLAEKAWSDGKTQAAVIAPDTEWGARVSEAFTTRWERLGGVVVEQQTYGPTDQDIALAVERLLDVDESEQRARWLRTQLRRDLKYEPRRRQDVDFIFMAAFARQARQLRPQIKFSRASDVPVYATSHVYGGTPRPEQDRDVDGVVFEDMPWILSPDSADPALHQAVEENWAESAATYGRLYAFGVDAYRVIPHLPRLRQFPFMSYQGVTGRITLDPSDRVKHSLVWAQFRGGRPHVLEPETATP